MKQTLSIVGVLSIVALLAVCLYARLRWDLSGRCNCDHECEPRKAHIINPDGTQEHRPLTPDEEEQLRPMTMEEFEAFKAELRKQLEARNK